MRATQATLSVLIVPVLMALPVAGHGQSPTATRGLLRGSLPPDSTIGTFRGVLPENASMGAGRGALPAGATVGAVPGPTPPGATTGLIRGVPPAGVPEGGPVEASTPTPLGVMRGALPPDATVGTFSTPLPPGARFGEPGPADLAGRLEAEARLSATDGNYRQAEALLYRSVAMREQLVGRDHPDLAGALEDNAKLLRQWNRPAAAIDMEARAKEIRTRLEPPQPPRPERISPPPPSLQQLPLLVDR